jgi:hypothetical protein
MDMSKFSKSAAALPPSMREKHPPPIPFVSKVNKMGKVDGTDADKSEWIKLEFLMDLDSPASGSKYSRQFAIFKDGCKIPEDWIKWVMAFREIEIMMPMKEPADKTRMFRTLLKGQALYYFEHHLMRRLEAEDSDVPDNELIELVLRDRGLEYIPKRAIRVQKYYMRRGSYMCLNKPVKQFIERLNDLNRYLLYFPEENPKQLDQDEIIEILDQAKARHPEWHESMVNAIIDIFEVTYEESVSYFKRLENLEKIRRTNGFNPSSLPVDNKKSVTSSVCMSKNHKGLNMWCHYCDKNIHNMADCREIAKFKQQKKAQFELLYFGWDHPIFLVCSLLLCHLTYLTSGT